LFDVVPVPAASFYRDPWGS